MKKTIYAVLILSFVGFSISKSQLIRDYGLKIGLASTNQNWGWPSGSGIAANSTARQDGMLEFL